jgi:hypothetical protein
MWGEVAAKELGLNTSIPSNACSEGMHICTSCCSQLTFFLSRTGSLSALITSAAAEGTTVTVATLFCTVSFTVTRRPFHSFPVSLAMSSPTCRTKVGKVTAQSLMQRITPATAALNSAASVAVCTSFF